MVPQEPRWVLRGAQAGGRATGAWALKDSLGVRALSVRSHRCTGRVGVVVDSVEKDRWTLQVASSADHLVNRVLTAVHLHCARYRIYLYIAPGCGVNLYLFTEKNQYKKGLRQ